MLGVECSPAFFQWLWFFPASAVFAAIEADLLASCSASCASSVGGEDNAQVIIANTVAAIIKSRIRAARAHT